MVEDEFQDWEWEVLHDFDDTDTFPQPYSSDFPDSNSKFLQVFEGDSVSGSPILFDYFSLPDHEPNSMTALESTTASNASLLDSENLDSGESNSENQSSWKITTELGSDLGEITTDVVNLERREADDGKLSGSDFVDRDEPLSAKNMYSSIVESEESGEEIESQDDEVLDDSYSSSSGNESVAMKSGDDGKESDHIDSVNDISNKDLGGEDEELMKVEAKSGEVEAQMRRRVVWWKVPFQVLRYCLLRASPAWSFSVALAFMGMAILGRRLYNMKRKTKSLLKLKIAVDDKKVSQFADRAARLNEAFSVVRRVPVVRASLTGAGANSWPAMSMR